MPQLLNLPLELIERICGHALAPDSEPCVRRGDELAEAESRQEKQIELATVSKAFQHAAERVDLGVCVIRPACVAVLQRRVERGALRLGTVKSLYIHWDYEELTDEKTRQPALDLASRMSGCQSLTLRMPEWVEKEFEQTINQMIVFLKDVAYIPQLRSLALLANQGSTCYDVEYAQQMKLDIEEVLALVHECPLLESLVLEMEVEPDHSVDFWGINVTKSHEPPILPRLRHIAYKPAHPQCISPVPLRLLAPWPDVYEDNLHLELINPLYVDARSTDLYLQIQPCHTLHLMALDGTAQSMYPGVVWAGPTVIVAERTELNARGTKHLARFLRMQRRLAAVHFGRVRRREKWEDNPSDTGSRAPLLRQVVEELPDTVCEVSVLQESWNSFSKKERVSLEALFAQKGIDFSPRSREQIQVQVLGA